MTGHTSSLDNESYFNISHFNYHLCNLLLLCITTDCLMFMSLSVPLFFSVRHILASFSKDPRAYNSILRPRVVGEWVGREEEDSDPLAAEMLQPPVPRAKTEGWVSKDNSPVGRWDTLMYLIGLDTKKRSANYGYLFFRAKQKSNYVFK